MSSDRKFPAAVAARVSVELGRALDPACERWLIVGSLRRERPEVGDLELLYIPRTERVPDEADLFGEKIWVDRADQAIRQLERDGILERRRNINGVETYGEKNKLMLHVATGLPVDLFATTADCWFNYLVCRTGPVELNQAIAGRAQREGWQWHPYGNGFSRGMEVRAMTSEQEVFAFVGLPYLSPAER